MNEQLPLAGVRVVEVSDGRGELAGRYMADLGADVLLVEPQHGAPARHRPPMVGDASLHFAVHHAGKRSVVADLGTDAGRARLLELLASADIWIESTRPGTLAALGLDPRAVLARFPHLVILSISEFGQSGPYADYHATEGVLMAMAGHLSRSGQPGLAPLLPPHGLAAGATAIQAVWAAMLAYWKRLETGHGDHLDLSLFEATGQIIDPAIGAVGTAVAGQNPLAAPRGRPTSAMYPIYRCADGYVRLILLAVRQWQSMLRWMGNPPELSDPTLNTIFARRQNAAAIESVIAQFLKDKTMDEVVAEGQRRGVPVAPVLTMTEVLDASHYRERGAFQHEEVTAGVTARVPSGMIEIDAVRAGPRGPAPKIGEHTEAVLAEVRAAGPRPEPKGSRPAPRAPLEGLRVLDLGVIVAGGEAGRLFADQGAEVLKVENSAFPDGSRAGVQGLMDDRFAAAQRNKLGVGINLRSPQGVDVFKRLVAVSDVLLENFKPGTLDSLGLGWDALHAINPSLVMVSTSAMGSRGPWSTWMGYGPLVRCSSGLTELWRYPDLEGSYCDGVTIFPDHLAARLLDSAALAAVMHARTIGQGVHIECAQAEIVLGVLATTIAMESVQPGYAVPGVGPTSAPWGVYPCAGDDEWCVITIRDDTDWQRLVGALGNPDWAHIPEMDTTEGRRTRAAEIDAALSGWTRERTPHEVTQILQAAGVPAGFMRRVTDLAQDPHLADRRFIRTLHQPWLEKPVLTENGPCLALGIAEPELRPAPLLGQHTREICARVLGMSPDEIEALFAAGALEEVAAPELAHATPVASAVSA
jgi:crotonobetainyl-CoA:carnitine CoA-transferase CaiB-like acyl-CoA transferase